MSIDDLKIAKLGTRREDNSIAFIKLQWLKTMTITRLSCSKS